MFQVVKVLFFNDIEQNFILALLSAFLDLSDVEETQGLKHFLKEQK